MGTLDLQSLPGIAAIFAGLAVFFAAYAIFAPVTKRAVSSTEQEFEAAEVDFVPTDGLGRTVRPILRNLMPALPANLVSTRRRRSIQELLVKSGNPWRLTADEFVGIRIAFAIIGFMLGTFFAVFNVVHIPFVPGWAFVVAFALAGYLIPYSVYNSRRQARVKSVLRDLPEALDLMVVTLDSGQTIEPTIRNVTPQLNEGTLREEFTRINVEIMAGNTLERALTGLYRNVDSEEAEAFARAVIQTTRLGAEVADTLKRQAEYARSNYEARLQRMIARLATVMFIPLIITMLPSFMIIFLAPQLASIAAYL
jgi:tight adherence protein C